jgi:hypothetical protein
MEDAGGRSVVSLAEAGPGDHWPSAANLADELSW